MMSEGVTDLRSVFDICDRTKSGVICVSDFLHLASDHLGSSYINVSSIIEKLWEKHDYITYEDFHRIFSSIILTGDLHDDTETKIGHKQYETHKRSRICHFKDHKSNIRKRRSSYSDFSENRPVCKLHYKCRMPEFVGNSQSLLKAAEPSNISSSSPDSGRKSNSGCSSMSDREESYECYGQGDEIDCEYVSVSSPTGDEIDHLRSPPNSLPPSNFTRRNSWARRSLRCSPSSNVEKLTPHRRYGSFRQGSSLSNLNNVPKRVGTTAVASQLYRTSSFSSGRSSVPDQDEMFSDESLEDNVIDLNQKVQMLQKQIGTLGENQMNIDDRYSKTKQENAALNARISMLEEQIRDTENRAEERISEEQRRNRELMARVEREKQLTVENFTIKQTSIEKEKQMMLEENTRMKQAFEKILEEKSAMESRLNETEYSISLLKEEKDKISEISKREREELRIERERSSQVIEELRCEVERLRAVEESFQKRAPVETQSPNIELENELKHLKDVNKELQEQFEDLQAQLLTSRLEEGRTLISATNNNSLAAEFEQMSNDEEIRCDDENEKLRGSLKVAREEIVDLKRYIDNILINIVDNHPELLEVKQK